MKTQTYTKINTLYRRYANLKSYDLPNKAWIAFQNKIILGSYSDDYMEYIKDLKFDCFSKIDGTNSKIVYLPSTGECFCGGKTDNADIVGSGQKAFLDEVIERIKPTLAELFPPESAKFAPVMKDKNQIQYYHCEDGGEVLNINENYTDGVRMFGVKLEEVPVYIYGEFFGKKIQNGGNYDKKKNRFYIFDICQQGWYVPIDTLTEYAEKLGLEVVPYLGQMTIPQAEEMVKQLNNGETLTSGRHKLSDKTAKRLPEEYAELRNRLSDVFSSKVQMTCNQQGKGKITIPFDSEEDLERIISMLDRINA